VLSIETKGKDMSERLKFMGRLREKELQAERLKLKIEGMRKSIRDLLDPFEDVVGLSLDHVAAYAVEAAELQIQLKEALAEIEAIKKALGK